MRSLLRSRGVHIAIAALASAGLLSSQPAAARENFPLHFTYRTVNAPLSTEEFVPRDDHGICADVLASPASAQEITDGGILPIELLRWNGFVWTNDGRAPFRLPIDDATDVWCWDTVGAGDDHYKLFLLDPQGAGLPGSRKGGERFVTGRRGDQRSERKVLRHVESTASCRDRPRLRPDLHRGNDGRSGAVPIG